MYISFPVYNKQILIAVGVGVTTAIVFGGLVAYCKKKNNQIPKKWRKVGEIAELICYPIKSCGPVRTNKVNCAILGIENDFLRDRVFMVAKTNGNFITARSYPILIKVQPTIENDILTLSAPGMMDISLDFKTLYGTPTNQTIVWDDTVETIDCGEEVARWFSRYVLQEDFGLRLAYFPGKESTRLVRGLRKEIDYENLNDGGALHDETSYMLINETSVLDLNTKIDDHVTPLRFRPNFVVKGAEAFAEDCWKWIRIGDETVFKVIKPCLR